MTNLIKSKSAWGALFLSTICLHLCALYFQYGMDLQPCVKCINQRAALYGISVASLMGYLGVNHFLMRITAIIGWLGFAVVGWIQSYQHVDSQLNPHPFFNSCEITPFFPQWLPLHEWLPVLFAAPGDCGTIDWQFMSFSMPQWMLGLFSLYSLVAAGVLINMLIGKLNK